MQALPSSAMTSAPTSSTDLQRARFAYLVRRTEWLRCCLLSLLSLCAGMALFRWVLPCLPADFISKAVGAHLPAGSGEALRSWLRLFGVRLPLYLLLWLAGLTRISGCLTSSLLAWRGLCEGTALGLLLYLWRGGLTLRLPNSLPPAFLLAAYGVWVGFDLTARLLLSVSSRRLARETVWPSLPLLSADPALRRALLRHTAMGLLALCILLCGCGIYIRLLLR
jgi:hypothetical protein